MCFDWFILIMWFNSDWCVSYVIEVFVYVGVVKSVLIKNGWNEGYILYRWWRYFVFSEVF